LVIFSYIDQSGSGPAESCISRRLVLQCVQIREFERPALPPRHRRAGRRLTRLMETDPNVFQVFSTNGTPTSPSADGRKLIESRSPSRASRKTTLYKDHASRSILELTAAKRLLHFSGSARARGINERERSSAGDRVHRVEPYGSVSQPWRRVTSTTSSRPSTSTTTPPRATVPSVLLAVLGIPQPPRDRCVVRESVPPQSYGRLGLEYLRLP